MSREIAWGVLQFFPTSRAGCRPVKQIHAIETIAPSRIIKAISSLANLLSNPPWSSATRNEDRINIVNTADVKPDNQTRVSGMPIEKIEVIYIPSKNDLLIQLAGRSWVGECRRLPRKTRTPYSIARIENTNSDATWKTSPAIMMLTPVLRSVCSSAIEVMAPPAACKIREIKSQVTNK